jgi:putative two-component system response regulator
LEDEVSRQTQQLRKAFEKVKKGSLETIYRLSVAAEYKDEDTGAHIKRMSHYSAAIAKKMGLNDRTVEAILYSAQMHDIGKIGILDKVVLCGKSLHSRPHRISIPILKRGIGA